MRQPLRIMSTTASALVQCVTRSHSGWMVADVVGSVGTWMFKFVSSMHGEYVFHAAWSDELAVSYKEFEKNENHGVAGLATASTAIAKNNRQ